MRKLMDNMGAEETRQSLAEGHGITFDNAQEAVAWLTVLPNKELEKIVGEWASNDSSCCLSLNRWRWEDILEVVAGAQAEATAKVIWSVAEKAGMRKVVEWLHNHGGCLDGQRAEWQQFKKENGI